MDTAGRSTAITVISAVPRWWALWLRTNGRRTSRRRRLKGPSRTERALSRLSFITFAHWSLFDRVPQSARTGTPKRLAQPYLLFQSNFNGGAAEYVEAFSLVVPWGMRAIWAGAHGVPDPLPIRRFERHIEAHKLPCAHYYCAYPEASARMVCSALELRREFDDFSREAATLEPKPFAAAYARFLTRVQALL